MKTRKQHIEDACLIYYSPEDGRWIAHSLRTDQIGVGDCVVDAMVDLMTATKNLLKLAKRDPTIAVFREAPPAIQKRIARAKPLPDVIAQIAYERFTHSLPKGYRIEVETPKNKPLRTKLCDGVMQ